MQTVELMHKRKGSKKIGKCSKRCKGKGKRARGKCMSSCMGGKRKKKC